MLYHYEEKGGLFAESDEDVGGQTQPDRSPTKEEGGLNVSSPLL